MEQTIDINILLNEIQKLNKQLENKNSINSKVKKKKRREGTYQLNKNGTARLQYMLNGIRYSDTVEAKTEEEAEAKLALFVEQVKKGTFVNTNYTVTEFTQIWLDNRVRPNSDVNRVPKYLSYLNNRVLPELGNIKLKKLTRQQLENFFNKLKKSKTLYKNRKNTTIAKGTVEKIRKIINAMLNYAVDCDLIIKNPCKGIKIKYNTNGEDDVSYIKKISEQNKSKISYFNVEEYKIVCKLLESEFNAFYDDTNISDKKKLRELGRRLIALLDLKTGMRRSELFGLAKGNGFYDLNIEEKTFSVNKTRHYAKGVGKYTKETKNSSSARIKSIPASLIPFIQKYYNFLDKIGFSNMYIFEDLSIDGISSWWDKWQEKNNIRNIRFHDIRHTHPTLLLYLGVDIKTISERLGHADIKTTMNIYADVLKELDTESSNKLDLL